MKRKVKISLRVGSWAGHPTKEITDFMIEKKETLSSFNFWLFTCSLPGSPKEYWFSPKYDLEPLCCPSFTIKTVLWKKEQLESL